MARSLCLEMWRYSIKKVVHEVATFLGNKSANAVTKSNGNKIAKQDPVEKIIIPPEERAEY